MTIQTFTVSESRRIEAPAGSIFDILSDPRRHPEIDGSGMLRGAITEKQVTDIGQVFAMKMHHEELGDYEMNNRVVEFEPARRIVWEPERRDVPADRWHYRWGYALEAHGDDATTVTEFFDCSRSPDEARQATKDGEVWRAAIAATLEHLDDLCAGKDSSAA